MGEHQPDLIHLSAPEIDQLEDAAYSRLLGAESPEIAAAALSDIMLISRFICRRAERE